MVTASNQEKSHLGRDILLGLVLFVSVFRLILPSIIKRLANNKLQEESPYFSFHIDDIDLHMLKGQYVVKGITGMLKENKEQFLEIESVSSNLPWRNIFDGKPILEVGVNKMNLSASQFLLNKAKQEQERVKQEMSGEEKDKDEEAPINIRSFVLRNSRVRIHDLMSFKGSEVREISDINASAFNLTPTENAPITNFKVSANVFGPSALNVMGQARLEERPLTWDINAILRNFDLKSVNPILREKSEAFIHQGKLDLYAEAESKGNEIEGYAKPFIENLKMDMPKGGFKFSGAAAAAGGQLVKVLLSDSESKTLATDIPFTFTDKLHIEIIPALEKAISYKAKENISPGLDDRIGERGLGMTTETMQAEEAE